MADLYLTLRADVLVLVEEGVNLRDDVEQQSRRRHVIRAVAAFVEAMAYQLRQVTLNCLGDDARPELLFVLREQQVDIGSNGIVQTKVLRMGSIPLIKFSMRTFDDIFHTKLCPEFDSPLFKNLIDTFTVRDRLMHPKRLGDLTIEDDEFAASVSAFSLVEAVFGNIVSKSNKILAAKLQALISETRKLEITGDK
jgi:hypothetical protein